MVGHSLDTQGSQSRGFSNTCCDVMCELHGLRVGSAWRTDPLSVDYEIIIGSLGVRHALSGLQLGAASSPRKTVGITSVGRHTTIGSWCLVGHNWAPS
mmetsp:Transcript_61440/g.198805  ORF Transcript_61440/g.198805 Transcript_61440/m.198805 type:complete len:98 (+) Transcript_61440:45-338(+)